LLLYYITDRAQFPGDEISRRHLLLDKIGEAVACGVDLVQLRGKDLSPRQLETCAREAARLVRERAAGSTRLLINSRSDVALACGADGVHLRSDDVGAREARLIWRSIPDHKPPVIGVSCHSPAEVEHAQLGGADFAVFGPVFEKKNASAGGMGLAALRQACASKIPVLALGGVTLENAGACADAGAAGIAAIRLFQENKIAEVVRRLRH
jgi:thiamine-phosphate pyrophosphorylase